jgi:hypothetical protein
MTTGTPGSAAANEEKVLEEMNRELAGWRDPAARLRQALARDELQLYCQPILSLRPPGAFAMAQIYSPMLFLRMIKNTTIPLKVEV